MPAFQRKLHLFVGGRPVATLAREIGIGQSTLQRWLSGQSPALRALNALAKGTGVPVGYWADDAVPARALAGTRAGETPPARVLAAAEAGPAVLVPEADEPRAIRVPDGSLSPLVEQGQVVVYDAARPGRVKDGELVVVELGGELVVRRRLTAGGMRIYTTLDPGAEPSSLPAAKAGNEYPVVALILRPRGPGGERVKEPGESYRAAEGEPSYGS